MFDKKLFPLSLFLLLLLWLLSACIPTNESIIEDLVDIKSWEISESNIDSEILWQKHIPMLNYRIFVAMSANIIAIGGGGLGGSLFAYDRLSGELQWKYGLDSISGVLYTPYGFVLGGLQRDHTTVMLNEHGSVVWTASEQNVRASWSGYSLVEDSVLVPTNSGVIQYDLESGETLDFIETTLDYRTGSANTLLYYRASTDTYALYDRNSLEYVWIIDAIEVGQRRQYIGTYNDVLIFKRGNETIEGLDSLNSEVLWTIKQPSSALAIYENRLVAFDRLELDFYSLDHQVHVGTISLSRNAEDSFDTESTAQDVLLISDNTIVLADGRTEEIVAINYRWP